MKRPRPYIPLSVRLTVIKRQMRQSGRLSPTDVLIWEANKFPLREQLLYCLLLMFGSGVKIALDHNPALILREFNKRTGKYKPDANDPDHLVYRLAPDHHLKTNVRGDGALRSDTAERVHRRRLEKNRKRREATRAGMPKKALSQAMREREKLRKAFDAKFAAMGPWPKGRKLRSRKSKRLL